MKNSETLNDLIEINNDRIAGYNKASGETDDSDLKTLFTKYSTQSQKLVTELRKLVHAEGSEPADGTTVKGKLYRTWMDVKSKFTGKDRKSVLSSCEYGEDAAQKAYTTALEEDDLSNEVRLLIEKQKMELREAHDHVKQLRDAQLA